MDILYGFEPKISGDTVTFSWKFSKDPQIFKKNEFYIKYDNIDISSIDTSVFYEIFVSLMVPILKAYKKEFLIMLPHEISENSVNLWLSYNEADNIKVFPTVKSSSLKRNAANRTANPKKLGILFGGGKDSLYAYKMNKELFGVENLLIISYVFPINYAHKREIDLRRENFALNHLKNDGAQVQKVYTNFRSIFEVYSYFDTLHTQLYYSMSFPLYIEHGLSYLTYSYEFTHYWNLDENQQPLYYFKRSRAEFDQFLSDYFTERLGQTLRIFNSNYYLSENLAFKILKERYNSLEDLMMCEAGVDPNTKWCMKCNKCGEFVLYSLANKFHTSEVDFNYFLTQSDYINKTIKNTEERNQTRNIDGNIPWYDGLITPLHYMSFCHMINAIDIEYWSTYLEKEAYLNLEKLKSWFGNKSYSVLDSYLIEGLKKLNHPYEKEIINVLEKYTTADDSEVIEILFGNRQVKIDYRMSYPLSWNNKRQINNIELSKLAINQNRSQLQQRYKHNIRGYNSETKDEIKYSYQEDSRGYSLFIDKTAPHKWDTAEVTYTIDELTVGKSYHIHLNVLSPYTSGQYTDRFNYYVLMDDKTILKEDISKWGNDNLIELYFKAPSNKVSLTIKVEALKNCEPWNWGKAAELVIKDLKIKQVANVGAFHASASSPYSILNEGKN